MNEVIGWTPIKNECSLSKQFDNENCNWTKATNSLNKFYYITAKLSFSNNIHIFDLLSSLDATLMSVCRSISLFSTSVQHDYMTTWDFSLATYIYCYVIGLSLKYVTLNLGLLTHLTPVTNLRLPLKVCHQFWHRSMHTCPQIIVRLVY